MLCLPCYKKFFSLKFGQNIDKEMEILILDKKFWSPYCTFDEFDVMSFNLVEIIVSMVIFFIASHMYSRRQKKFPYSTVLLPYLTVLLMYFNRTYALLPAYFCRTLIVLLPHPLTYCNRTTAILSPYRDTTIKDW